MIIHVWLKQPNIQINNQNIGEEEGAGETIKHLLLHQMKTGLQGFGLSKTNMLVVFTAGDL